MRPIKLTPFNRDSLHHLHTLIPVHTLLLLQSLQLSYHLTNLDTFLHYGLSQQRHCHLICILLFQLSQELLIVNETADLPLQGLLSVELA